MALDRVQVRSLYASADDYMRAFTTSAARLVMEGFLVQEDADELVADARRQAAELFR